MAKRFAVIGMGRFGARLAANLAAAGQEVIAVDLDRQRVEAMRDKVTLSVMLDATSEDALRSQGVDQVDVAVVSIGEDFQASTLATVMLKQLGVPRVVARATSPVAARVLARVGADSTVNPEDESADRWTARLMGPGLLRQFELAPNQSMLEIKVPAKWVGRSLAQLGVRREYQVQVVAIRRPQGDSQSSKSDANSVKAWPASPHPAEQQDSRAERRDDPDALAMADPDLPLAEDMVLMVLGDNQSLAKLPGE